jgi:hypothetical protein
MLSCYIRFLPLSPWRGHMVCGREANVYMSVDDTKQPGDTTAVRQRLL